MTGSTGQKDKIIEPEFLKYNVKDVLTMLVSHVNE